MIAVLDTNEPSAKRHKQMKSFYRPPKEDGKRVVSRNICFQSLPRKLRMKIWAYAHNIGVSRTRPAFLPDQPCPHDLDSMDRDWYGCLYCLIRTNNKAFEYIVKSRQIEYWPNWRIAQYFKTHGAARSSDKKLHVPLIL
jgi:hypothetical protein